MVWQWPIPQTIEHLEGFWGLTIYYGQFIKGYASLASPLTDLLGKDSFTWTPEANKFFAKLKEAITFAPILALPKFSKPFRLEMDSFGTFVGAVLSQKGHPIAYFSKKLSMRTSKQLTFIRELYAIKRAIGKFKHYLLGHKFIILPNQKSLKSPID